MIAATLSEGLMGDVPDTKTVPPIIWQTIAALLAITIGSVGVTGWGQSGFYEALEDHRREVRADVQGLRDDIDNLRQQVVGSHNMTDLVRVQRAIEEIDRDDSLAWTGGGKPRIYAIEARLIEHGYPYLKVSASLRDLAWGLRELH